MAYTDPSSLTFATNENPLASAKLNQATNDQFLALFPDGVAADSWTPVLEGSSSNPTTTSTAGKVYVVGGLVFVWARFVFDTAGSGIYFVELPVASSGLPSSSASGSGSAIGSWVARDASASGHVGGPVNLRAADEAWFAVGDYTKGMFANNSLFVVANGDVLSFQAVYPSA